MSEPFPELFPQVYFYSTDTYLRYSIFGGNMAKICFYFLLFTLVSCSFSSTKPKGEATEDEVIELVSDTEYETHSSLNLYDDTTQEQLAADITIETKVPELVFEKQTSRQEAEALVRSLSNYTVKNGETLMSISYQLYGNSIKWRELEEINQNALVDNVLPKGIVIKYYAPSTPPNFPQGRPYIVRVGDYLSKISENIYNRRSKLWPWLWENNKNNYSSPDQIFAGLPIYYLPLNNQILVEYGYKPIKSRDVASKL